MPEFDDHEQTELIEYCRIGNSFVCRNRNLKRRKFIGKTTTDSREAKLATNFSTLGGQVTRGETFSKLIYHIREAQDMAATMSHLHNTEDSNQEKLKAKLWLVVSERLKLMQNQLIDLAKGGLHS